MCQLVFDGVSFCYDELEVFKSLSMILPGGAVTAVLGPSGCGKTTLLNLISGSLSPSSGSLAMDSNCSVSYLFQEPRLLPWKTVYGNIELVLKNRLDIKSAGDRIAHFLDMVGLSEFRDYYPDQLSGGMKQRVSMARAFSSKSELLLMDEPFQALDPKLKMSLISSFKNLWQEEKRTTVFVTHDIQEALVLGDRIIMLSSLPADVSAEFDNPCSASDRTMRNSRLLELERELYTAMAGM